MNSCPSTNGKISKLATSKLLFLKGQNFVDFLKKPFVDGHELKFKTPEGWDSVLSTIRKSIFSNQNCELSVDDSGDLLLTYLDGDPSGLKKKIAGLLENRKSSGLNKVSWWEGLGLKIKIEDRFNMESGAEIQ